MAMATLINVTGLSIIAGLVAVYLILKLSK